MIKDAKKAQGRSDDLVVDLHPDRPVYRGMAAAQTIISLEADPTFEEISGTGAVIEKSSEAHTILDDMFLVSGEIPRVTPYETGLKGAVRFDPETKDWYSDEQIADERFLAVNLKGKSTPQYLSRRSIYSFNHRKGPCYLHGMQPWRRSQCLKARN
jgi:7,8-dihydropterin-6-yl-methyl-4-(beta-D-ribofuranosyl)aminobenzene 5'-phosphate synthase